MEDMVGNGVIPSTNLKNAASFWKGKTVFLTGHTGFKGSWLSIWLNSMGARVTGYALKPPTEPNLYDIVRVNRCVDSTIGDIRNLDRLQYVMCQAAPEIVFHLAAQPLVRESYCTPVDTYSTNVMGTVNLLEAIRQCHSVRAVVNVTTDKCYNNQELDHFFQEEEPLGGYDPYSSSKACSEIVTAAWRSSYFNPLDFARHRVAIATARAGNVIGGGDWARDRLIPDCIRALQAGEPIIIRNPHAVRPWQHVLEPLSGYLSLAQLLYEHGCEYSGGWNFGPVAEDARPVEWIAKKMCNEWGGDAKYEVDTGEQPHEAHYLKLDITKAQTMLGWNPRWNLERAIDATLEWVRVWQNGGDPAEITLAQIKQYEMC